VGSSILVILPRPWSRRNTTRPSGERAMVVIFDIIASSIVMVEMGLVQMMSREAISARMVSRHGRPWSMVTMYSLLLSGLLHIFETLAVSIKAFG